MFNVKECKSLVGFFERLQQFTETIDWMRGMCRFERVSDMADM